MRTASPFSMSTIALAYNYIYKNGVLAYTTESLKLRILSLHGNVTGETVVDIQSLMSWEIPQFDCWSRYEIRPIHHSHGILSILLCDGGSDLDDGGWLVFWSIIRPGETIQILRLETVCDLFVRNNHRYLYYGVSHNTYGEDMDTYEWTLRVYDLSSTEQSQHAVPLAQFGSMSIGHNACFEVIDDYLYGASSEQQYDTPTDSWNSYYYIFRLKIDKDVCLQKLPRSRSKRRSVGEGTDDNRWSTLELVQDEKTGAAVLYEIRKAWSTRTSCSQRNCYRKELDFTDLEEEDFYPHSKDMARGNLKKEGVQNLYSARDLHVGDCGANPATPCFPDVLAFAYSASARCFVDLVKFQTSIASAKQLFRLRIRPKSETLADRPLSQRPCAIVGQPVSSEPGVYVCPPDSILFEGSNSPRAHIGDMLEAPPPASMLNLYADERCLVFSSDNGGEARTMKPVTVICFDPGVRFYNHYSDTDEYREAAEPQLMQDVSQNRTAKECPWLYTVHASYLWIRSSAGHHLGFDFTQRLLGGNLLEH